MRYAIICILIIAPVILLVLSNSRVTSLSQSAIIDQMATGAGNVRTIRKVVKGMMVSEGAGVNICRTVGTGQLRNLDPYLMLDELKLPANEASAGFPDHPHRGFETCSIMLEGKMEHYDSAGNHGVIEDGGVQWMTAGRGIIHSEMPKTTHGNLWGFQLWINLPSEDKMIKPRYQDYQAKDIPNVHDDHNKCDVRVMAGEYNGNKGPIELRNPGLLMDVKVFQGGKFKLDFPSHWNAFCYVYDGSGSVAGQEAPLRSALVLEHGDYVEAESSSESGLRFLLIAGKPIGEKIVQYGPFVMNSMEEIQQAFEDYQSGRLQNPDDDVWGKWQ